MMPRITTPTLKIGDCEVKQSQYARNLGFVFEQTLGIERHVQSTCRTAYFHMRNIGKISKFIDKTSVKILVHAFVTSRLDYCNSLLHGADQYSIDKLQRVQNSAARLITKTSKREHITPVLAELHWLPVRQRIIFKLLVFVFKALHGLGPVYLQELVHRYQPARDLRSISTRHLVVPKTRTTSYGDRAFCVAGPFGTDSPVTYKTSMC